jgi:hypothetical protein
MNEKEKKKKAKHEHKEKTQLTAQSSKWEKMNDQTTSPNTLVENLGFMCQSWWNVKSIL